jgi:hypothetical protein
MGGNAVSGVTHCPLAMAQAVGETGRNWGKNNDIARLTNSQGAVNKKRPA